MPSMTSGSWNINSDPRKIRGFGYFGYFSNLALPNGAFKFDNIANI